MASLLILGGSGFFGKSFLDGFRRGLLSPWKIDEINIVARSAGLLKQTNYGLVEKNVNLYNIDIANCNSLPKADFIIHAASSTDASRYLSKPEIERANILASINNYCQIARTEHRNSKIIYVSSGAIYGQQPSTLDKIPEQYPLGQIKDMVDHKRDYSAAKRDAESVILELGKEGLNTSIARCFNFIGPYLPREQHFAFGNFINDGLNGRNIVINARHQVIRAHQYTDDLISWLMHIAEVANPFCPTFNVGSERAIEIRDLAWMVANYFKVGVNMQPLESNAIDRYVPSTEKIKNELGQKNLVDLEEALDRTVHHINTIRD